MTDINKKTLEYNVQTATCAVKASLKIDAFGEILGFSCKPASKDKSLMVEDLHFVIDECIKEAASEGYLPKHKQTRLDVKPVSIPSASEVASSPGVGVAVNKVDYFLSAKADTKDPDFDFHLKELNNEELTYLIDSDFKEIPSKVLTVLRAEKRRRVAIPEIKAA
jgi:hypothetical protein